MLRRETICTATKAAADATAAAVAGAAIVREAMIDPDNLVWPTGISADQKTAALADLVLNTVCFNPCELFKLKT